MYRIYHSPDTDDLLLFWKLIQSSTLNNISVTAKGFDTEELNQLALRGEPDICAVSAAILPELEGHYGLSPYGASIGRGFGPVVISKRLRSISDLHGVKVAVPGMTTTAALVFRKLAPQAELITIPITPFRSVFDALDSGKVDAAVLIHEGQLAWKELGYERITDLGSWWHNETQLPLPLGVNVVRLFSNPQETALLHRALRDSVEYGLNNSSSLLRQILEANPKLQEKLSSAAEFERYLSMYANEDSRCLDKDCLEALNLLLGVRISLLT